MKKTNYNQDIGATELYTKRITEATNGLCHSNRKDSTNDYFIFIIRFYLKSSYQAAKGVGDDIIGKVKTITEVFCKDNIKNMTNYWPGGS